MSTSSLHLSSMNMTEGLSIVHGSNSGALQTHTLATLLAEQADQHGDHTALISWTGTVLTYNQLHQRCIVLARALLAIGALPGDHIGIFAENCEVYVELTFAAAMIRATTVILNTNYTPDELANAIVAAGRLLEPAIADSSETNVWLFTSSHIGARDLRPCLSRIEQALQLSENSVNQLQRIVLIRTKGESRHDSKLFLHFDEFVQMSSRHHDAQLLHISREASPHDVCNMQFTSGTTGNPKAAMLTH
ncbi:hypothetical protein E4T47_08703 [Aureobasidium subglaciale]|nr:hypothetical protein E4T47_08703 [Aureobasidium subglaciale]